MDDSRRYEPVDFGVDIIADDRATIVAVEGEADLITANYLQQTLLAALESAYALVVDLCGCSFMDSEGLQAILMARRVAARNGVPLAVSCHSASAAHLLFELTIADQIDVHESRDGALAAVAGAPGDQTANE